VGPNCVRGKSHRATLKTIQSVVFTAKTRRSKYCHPISTYEIDVCIIQTGEYSHKTTQLKYLILVVPYLAQLLADFRHFAFKKDDFEDMAG
jgi:uncharacterized membrane protein